LGHYLLTLQVGQKSPCPSSDTFWTFRNYFHLTYLYYIFLLLCCQLI